jgi:hypothetical protein
LAARVCQTGQGLRFNHGQAKGRLSLGDLVKVPHRFGENPQFKFNAVANQQFPLVFTCTSRAF